MSTDEPSASPLPALTFRYQPGTMHARFYHSTYDYIELDIRMGGDTTWVQPVEPGSCEPLGPEQRHAEASIEQTVYFSTPMRCGFTGLIRFLEAITIGVEECAFTWDPEGPFGSMRWFSHGTDSGAFKLVWSSGGANFDRTTSMPTYDAIDTLYSAFRTFVDSPEYEPFRYERIQEWDAYSLILKDASLGEFARAVASLPANQARGVLNRASAFAASRSSCPNEDFGRRQTLEWFMLGRHELDDEPLRLPAVWDGWNEAQRTRHLGRQWSGTRFGWDGSNLRRLRSEMIEEWLRHKRRKKRRTT
jgi:hypothetical protein